jgi:Uma2 family endonuclease
MATFAKIHSVSVPAAPVPTSSEESPELYRFCLAQYEQMGRLGILTEDDRVELVEGVLYRKPMKNGPHSISARESAAVLSRLIPAGAYFVTREDPVRIPGRAGMPEPDVSVVRGRSRDYTEQPEGGDVPLVVEVAEKSLAFDRTEKLFTYAAGGISVYWIVNLVDRQVEVYSNPGPDGYRFRQIYASGQVIDVVIDGVTLGQVAVVDLLP